MSDIRQRLQAEGARLPELAEDLCALDRLFDTDVQSALNKVRVAAEKVLYRLCTAHSVSWGNAEPTLERMLGPLVSAGVLPKDVAVHVRTVQANANFGSHFQESPPSAAHLGIAANALAEFLAWYERRSHPAPSGATDRPVPTRALRILVVEESRMNQRGAEALLCKQGHTVVIAFSGGAALAAVRQETFDLILLQVQMEGMDGLEATARIRDLERQRGDYTPILGMASDPACQARAVAEGMDGAVSRPLNLPELRGAIERLDVIDWSRGLKLVGGDESLFRQLAEVFMEEVPDSLERIRTAITERNSPRLQSLAHTLEGSFKTLGAVAAMKAATRLKLIAKGGDLVGVEEAYATLAREVDRARAALARYLRSPKT
jgi:CheY-like chemotaxis protein